MCPCCDALHRVLHGQFEEAFVAAEGGGEVEEGQVVAGVVLVARCQSAVAGEPGVRSITHLRRLNRSLESIPLRAIPRRCVGYAAIVAGQEDRKPCRRAVAEAWNLAVEHSKRSVARQLGMTPNTNL